MKHRNAGPVKCNALFGYFRLYQGCYPHDAGPWEPEMLESELFGLWSADARYGPAAQSDDWLVFQPDGTGRYEFINWTRCSADFFRWDTPRKGIVRIIGARQLQLAEDCKSLEEKPSLFGDKELPYEISNEDTPSGKRMRVLRVPLDFPMTGCFGFARADLAGLEEPRFDFQK